MAAKKSKKGVRPPKPSARKRTLNPPGAAPRASKGSANKTRSAGSATSKGPAKPRDARSGATDCIKRRSIELRYLSERKRAKTAARGD